MGKKKRPTKTPPGGKKRATPLQRTLFEKAKIDSENLLTTADVKQLFSISESSIKRWRRDLVIPHTKIGGSIYYFKHAIIQILIDRTKF